MLLALLDFVHLSHQACHKALEMGQRLKALLKKTTHTKAQVSVKNTYEHLESFLEKLSTQMHGLAWTIHFLS